MRKYLSLCTLLLLSVACWPATAPADASGPTFDYGWAASPVVDPEGNPLALPAHYEVWLQRDEEPAVQVATVVGDTTWTLVPDGPAEYRMRVCAVDSLGRCSEFSPWSDPLVVPRVTDAPAAAVADLDPAYPNPFNPRTTLRYTVPGDLAAGAPLGLEILDARGARVRTLPVQRTPGTHTVVWNGRDRRGLAVASGTYLARYVCGRDRRTTCLTLVK